MPEEIAPLLECPQEDTLPPEEEKSPAELQAEAFSELQHMFETNAIRSLLPANKVSEFEEWNASGDY